MMTRDAGTPSRAAIHDRSSSRPADWEYWNAAGPERVPVSTRSVAASSSCTGSAVSSGIPPSSSMSPSRRRRRLASPKPLGSLSAPASVVKRASGRQEVWCRRHRFCLPGGARSRCSDRPERREAHGGGQRSFRSVSLIGRGVSPSGPARETNRGIVDSIGRDIYVSEPFSSRRPIEAHCPVGDGGGHGQQQRTAGNPHDRLVDRAATLSALSRASLRPRPAPPGSSPCPSPSPGALPCPPIACDADGPSRSPPPPSSVCCSPPARAAPPAPGATGSTYGRGRARRRRHLRPRPRGRPARLPRRAPAAVPRGPEHRPPAGRLADRPGPGDRRDRAVARGRAGRSATTLTHFTFHLRDDVDLQPTAPPLDADVGQGQPRRASSARSAATATAAPAPTSRATLEHRPSTTRTP